MLTVIHSNVSSTEITSSWQNFLYQKPFPVGPDKTEYRKLTSDYVSTIEVDGRSILKVDPKGLALLAQEAMYDVGFYLRHPIFKNSPTYWMIPKLLTTIAS
ncbi:MAG: hypothetical protein U5K79_03250 [Cyclobacteriaceae bacterium]|nr:hypothetical protein [Cyclobacteriaceae bacterium]